MLKKIRSFGFLRNAFYYHQIFFVTILLVSLVVSIFIWSLSKEYYDNRAKENFERNVHDTLNHIEKRVHRYENALLGGIALFHASKNVSRQTWHDYVEALQPEKFYPGFQGIGFSLMLKPEEVAPLVEKIRTHDYPSFALKPTGKREQYSTVLYLEPMDKRNQQAIGYDMFSEPTRRQAMERARDTGLPSISNRVTLLQEIDSDLQSGFIMYLPLYKTAKDPQTIKARRNQIVGFIYSPFRMNNLMDTLLDKDEHMLNFEIYDSEESTEEDLLYRSNMASFDTAKYQSLDKLQIGGNQWYIHCSSTAEFDAQINTNYPLILTLGGLFVYFFLLFIILALLNNRQNLQKRTKELESSRSWLNTLLESATDGIHILDLDGQLIEYSPSFLDMLGYSKKEAQYLSINDWDAKHSREEISENFRSMPETSLTIETIYRRKNGTLFDAEITIRSIRLDEKRFIYASARDITKRKQNENELQKLLQAIEQSPNTIVITNLEGDIEYVNNAFSITTGYTYDEAIGKNARLLQSMKTPLTTYETMWKQLTQGKNWSGEFINRRKDKTEYIEAVKASPIFNIDGTITHYMAIKEDVTKQKHAQERIHFLANFDTLTGLPNRYKLKEQTIYAINIAKRTNGKLALLFLDIDHFKNINDTLGHSIGDTLLIELAQRFRSFLRENDIVSRLGGDEFIFMLPNTDEKGIANLSKKLLHIISQSIAIEHNELTVTASIGIAIYPTDGADYETLSKNADIAMYRTKQDGRNSYSFFTEKMQERSIHNLELTNALHHALERNELYLAYQPQISLHDNRIIGAEALLRWKHPKLGNIPPSEFIPLAEDSGLILAIGEWVLRTAVRQAKSWIDHGLSPMIVGVNLSAVQFRHKHLPELVTEILDGIGLRPEYLELELTEAVTMHNPNNAYAVMDDLHERGIKLSIDDFGTGYSSLSYLKKFKVYKLKIDQSFIRDIYTDQDDRAIVNAIISMAQSLGLKTIAEGVENREQLNYLQKQGCDEIQGYYYSKPLPAEEFERFVRGKGHLAALTNNKEIK